MKRCKTLALTGLLLHCAATVSADSPADESMSVADRCRAEIVELHVFLEEWSNAKLPQTDDAFDRFARVIAPSFEIIGPDGSSGGREPTVEAIRGAYGRWRDKPGRIRIENVRLREADGRLAVATYEEWHDFPYASDGRLSTVLFGANSEAPNGLVWLHLHEVWLEPEAEAAQAEGE